MNIDRNLVNRAMEKAGEDPITDEEWTNGSNRTKLIKDVYLSIILSALAESDWTSQKKRTQLQVVRDEENLTNYQYMYLLPIDCAKPVALLNEGEYLCEGEYLYTNTDNAILVYVKNYFTGIRKYEYTLANPQPTEDTFNDGEYFIYDEEIKSYITAISYTEGAVYYTREVIEEDYNYYDTPKFDAILEDYIVCILASNIVLKLTGDAAKYQLLFSEARIIENKAIKNTVAQGHNKDKGNPYWGDILGLPNYGEY